MASAAEEMQSCMTISSWIVLYSGSACQSSLEFIVDQWSPPKKKGMGQGAILKCCHKWWSFSRPQYKPAFCWSCLLLFSLLRNYTDRRPSCAMAAGAGTYAERLSCPGPGGNCCAEGDLSSETAEAWIGPARISAAAWCLGAQTGLSDQLWVVSELLSSDFLSHEPTRTVRRLKLVLW